MDKPEWQDFASHFIGYPCNFAYDYTPVFGSFKYCVNNVGDPSVPNNYIINSKETELKVIAWFKELWNISPCNSWGYVTSSGTEGNMEGFYMARRVYPEGVLYHSDQSHYSIGKIADLLRIPSVVVKSQPNGEMDYADFEASLDTRKPAIVCATIGTTMMGAHDDVSKIHQTLERKGMIDKHYIHIDGALDGFFLPLLTYDMNFKDYAHSISISCHKFLGVTFPCGVYLMDSKYNTADRFIQYVNTVDNTISGSRNGHASVFIWHAIQTIGKSGFEKDVKKCITAAAEMVLHLKKSGVNNVFRNPNSLTVVLPAPSKEFVERWGMPVHGNISHAIVLPHVDKDMRKMFIDEYLEDIK
ncbi:histidine decarboxylase [Tetraselmis virus 1]|uniref:Histidine decarboxylase n=1 Tax=Tetraselmis virus 1 TaxID=2060617 RepID=A0A2P0VP20_9VIRU|nr:histidine decarboxylase [Tetraselmis virus 1]AUF82658.1 histidine decarboxylase [Tetraselmis virus 1]